MGFGAWVMKFVVPLYLLDLALAGTFERSSPDAVLGTMKGLVDGYVNKYTAEEDSFKEASEAMQSVIDQAADAEAKARAVDEKAKLKKAHEEKLKEFAGFVRTLDDTVKALRPGEEKDWKEQFPELKAHTDKIYAAYPALIQSPTLRRISQQPSLLVRNAAARVGSNPDAVLGTMKGLVDGYVSKYTTEEANFKEASEAMQSVIDKAADAEGKARAVDEKAKMKQSHEDALREIAGFVRTLDDTVKALRPGDDSDWKDQFPDLKSQISEIYTAYPALIQQLGTSSTLHRRVQVTLHLPFTFA